MIWIHLSTILHTTRFTGIARTEYELALYAYELINQGHAINFCTFDVALGFIEVDRPYVDAILKNLKQGYHTPTLKKTRSQKFKRSFFKRLNRLKISFGIINHCFRDGDTLISVGQSLNSQESKGFLLVKKHKDLKVKVLCHDLIPINHPELASEGAEHLFTIYINHAVKFVDYFYCNSNHTKNELMDYYHKKGIPACPMSVVTLGCDLHKRVITGKSSSLVEYLTTQKYILFVSTIEIRKNHQLIYDMYVKLIESGVKNLPKMVFVGGYGWKVDNLIKDLATNEQIKNQIIIAANITDVDMVNLYKHCWFTIYPSFIEGYGLPVAESLAFGKYCLSSNAGSLPEAGGDLIDYINPYDFEGWCDKFLYLINNPEYITSKEEVIQRNYNPVSWRQFAQNILDSELSNKPLIR